MYNIHPIFVHFPIALFFVYSIIKILPFYKWFSNFAWRDIERFLLVFGVLGSFMALSTGEIAEKFTGASHKMVETHAFFATFSSRMYLILLIGEIASYLNTKNYNFLQIPIIKKILLLIERIVMNKTITLILVILGFVSLFLTGVLGGAMVYGTTADPLAPFILKLLNLN